MQETVLGTNNAYGYLNSLLVDGSNTYYVGANGPPSASITYSLVGAPPGGSPAPLTTRPDIEYLIMDAVNLYFTDTTVHKLLYCPRASGCPTSGPNVLIDEGVLGGIGLDETTVIWSNDAHDIRRITKP